MAKKKKKRKSVLKKQSPLVFRVIVSKCLKAFKSAVFYFPAILAAILFALYFTSKPISSWKPSEVSITNTQTRQETNNKNNDKKIRQLKKHILKVSNKGFFNDYGEQVAKKFGYQKTQVIRSYGEPLQVVIEERVPVFKLDPKDSSFISSDGFMYQNTHQNSDSMPLLTGVKKLEKIQQKQAIESIFELNAALKNRLLDVSKYHYDLYRGLSFWVKPHETEVMIGFKDFEEKISKLKTILHKSKIRGRLVSRVELDYNGNKVFTKYKNL